MDNRRVTHDRQSNRLPHYDYSQPGAYYVTLVTYERACLFGEIREGEVWLSAIGQIADRAWREIPEHFAGVTEDDYVIMPNHVHGIIWIEGPDLEVTGEMELEREVGARHASPLRGNGGSNPRGVKPHSLGAIVGSFKSAVTKQIHKIRGYEHLRVWQRNYYEHVIRDEKAYEEIVCYITANPSNWELDREYPSSQYS